MGPATEHAGDDRYFRRMWERGGPHPDTDEDGVASHNGGPASTESHGGARSGKPLWLRIGSDAEIADKVAADLQERFGQIVFCGQFWFYRETHWEPIPEETLWLAASRYDGALFKTINDKLSRVTLNKTRIDSVLTCMRPGLTSRDFFDKPAVGINCASGFIRFDDHGTPRLEPHHPDHRCRHTLPGHWPATFGAAQRQTSLLNTLLEGCFRDDVDKEEKIDLLAEVAGIAALGLATKILKPKALVLKGELAENGKSQILDVLRALLPKSAVASISPARFDDRTFTCHLDGKLLNAPDELASGDAIASETFKQIITGEPLTVRDLYKSAFEFRPVAQHVYATNNLPSFRGGMDRGVRRRLMVLCCNRVIPVDRADRPYRPQDRSRGAGPAARLGGPRREPRDRQASVHGTVLEHRGAARLDALVRPGAGLAGQRGGSVRNNDGRRPGQKPRTATSGSGRSKRAIRRTSCLRSTASRNACLPPRRNGASRRSAQPRAPCSLGSNALAWAPGTTAVIGASFRDEAAPHTVRSSEMAHGVPVDLSESLRLPACDTALAAAGCSRVSYRASTGA